MKEVIIGGLIGVGGVTAGALLNWRISLDLAKRQEKTEQKRDERVERRARRIVADELLTLADHLQIVALQGYNPSAALMQSDRFLATSEWHRNKDLLAERLNDDEWTRLSLPVFYHNVEFFRIRLVRNQTGKSFEGDELRRIVDMFTQAQEIANELTGISMSPTDPDIRTIVTDSEGRPVER